MWDKKHDQQGTLMAKRKGRREGVADTYSISSRFPFNTLKPLHFGPISYLLSSQFSALRLVVVMAFYWSKILFANYFPCLCLSLVSANYFGKVKQQQEP